MPLKTFLACSFILAVLVTAEGRDCPEKYKRFTPDHTFCKDPNPTCKVYQRGVTEEQKKLILKVHNEYRSRLATGQEKLAGGLPTAANMMELEWDEELAIIAQRHAESCDFNHDCNKCRRVERFSVGQNIGMSSINSPNMPEINWTNFIKDLYDEVVYFDKKLMKPFVPAPEESETTYGHFTQLAWGTSSKVGCGFVMFEDDDDWNTNFYVCNYGPGGNVRGGEMYKQGATCSQCPSNSCCGDSCKKQGVKAQFPGLCKA
uniref:U19-Deinotoxin-Dsu1b_1 n=1 Tax=Deinopis subrufa TaxID=1905329 RepID=A0A4Q8KAS1_DEISU